eukprot:scaffold34674_cov90-Isochrysis_galbana.AAC.3
MGRRTERRPRVWRATRINIGAAAIPGWGAGPGAGGHPSGIPAGAIPKIEWGFKLPPPHTPQPPSIASAPAHISGYIGSMLIRTL